MIPAFRLDGVSAWRAVVGLLSDYGIEIPILPWIAVNTVSFSVILVMALANHFTVK
jgi:hypothetical protein